VPRCVPAGRKSDARSRQQGSARQQWRQMRSFSWSWARCDLVTLETDALREDAIRSIRCAGSANATYHRQQAVSPAAASLHAMRGSSASAASMKSGVYSWTRNHLEFPLAEAPPTPTPGATKPSAGPSQSSIREPANFAREWRIPCVSGLQFGPTDRLARTDKRPGRNVPPGAHGTLAICAPSPEKLNGAVE